MFFHSPKLEMACSHCRSDQLDRPRSSPITRIPRSSPTKGVYPTSSRPLLDHTRPLLEYSRLLLDLYPTMFPTATRSSRSYSSPTRSQLDQLDLYTTKSCKVELSREPKLLECCPYAFLVKLHFILKLSVIVNLLSWSTGRLESFSLYKVSQFFYFFLKQNNIL